MRDRCGPHHDPVVRLAALLGVTALLAGVLAVLLMLRGVADLPGRVAAVEERQRQFESVVAMREEMVGLMDRVTDFLAEVERD